jgi:CHAT domain-containing protein
LGKDFDVGTTGLARAWLRAGASNVVMSLWNVDDQATRVLMSDFVERLVTGVPPDRALRQAAMTTRARYPNPVHWAAFGVFGAPLHARATPGTQR